MSRQRFIYPSIWQCPELADLPPCGVILFVGCFSTADDHGRRRAEPELLKADIFPLRRDVSVADVGQLRDKLAQVGLIRVYGGGKFLDLPTWEKWQTPKYRKDSRLPAFRAESVPNPGQLRDKLARSPGQIGSKIVPDVVVPYLTEQDSIGVSPAAAGASSPQAGTRPSGGAPTTAVPLYLQEHTPSPPFDLEKFFREGGIPLRGTPEHETWKAWKAKRAGEDRRVVRAGELGGRAP